MPTIHPIFDLPHRRSIRLPGFDYSQPGAYFVTLCLQGHACLFWDMQSTGAGSCGYNSLGAPLAAPHPLTLSGQIVQETWKGLPTRFQDIALDAMVIMPNHVHGILHIVSEDATMSRPSAPSALAPRSGLVADGKTSAQATGAASSAQATGAATSAQATGAASSAQATGAASSAPTTLGGIMRAFKSLSALAANRILPYRRNPFWQRNYYEHIIRNDDELHHIRDYIRNNPDRWAMDRENPDIPLSLCESPVPEWYL